MESEGRVDSVRPIRAAAAIESVRNAAEARCGMDWCPTSVWPARRGSLPSGSLRNGRGRAGRSGRVGANGSAGFAKCVSTTPGGAGSPRIPIRFLIRPFIRLNLVDAEYLAVRTPPSKARARTGSPSSTQAVIDSWVPWYSDGHGMPHK